MSTEPDDLLHQLRALRAQQPPADLRERTLDATRKLLQRSPAPTRPTWRFELSLGAALCLLVLGLGWSSWVEPSSAGQPASPTATALPDWQRSLDLSPELASYLELRLVAASQPALAASPRLLTSDPS